MSPPPSSSKKRNATTSLLSSKMKKERLSNVSEQTNDHPKQALAALAVQLDLLDRRNNAVTTLERSAERASSVKRDAMEKRRVADIDYEMKVKAKDDANSKLGKLLEDEAGTKSRMKRLQEATEEKLKAWGEEIVASRKKREQLEAVGLSRKPIKDALEVKAEATQELEDAELREDTKWGEFEQFDAGLKPIKRAYREKTGQEVFDIWGLAFSFNAHKDCGLSKTHLRTIKRALKAYGFPGSEHFNLQNSKNVDELWTEICKTVGIKFPKLLEEEDADTKAAREFLINFSNDPWMPFPGSNQDTDSNDDADDVGNPKDDGGITNCGKQSKSQDLDA
jgi:hypothetical protein